MKTLIILLASVIVAAGMTFNVRDYGAIGDGVAVDSPAIQKAIEQCVLAGGGTVELGPGTYLSKPLFLHGSNVTFELAAGAVLLGTTNFGNYRVGGRIVGLINAEGMENVCLSGHGAIDGAGEPWWPAVKEAKRNGTSEPRRRPKMVNFLRCHGVAVRDVTLRNSPSFHLVPVDCDDVLIDGVTIQAPGDSPNTDAIDPSACKRVRILNCTLDVGDDNVAVKAGHSVPGRRFCCEDIVVSNCTCLHGHGISIGSETSGGLSNMIVTHCSFTGTTSGLRIKSNREKGGLVENVLCRDVTMKDVRYPINIASYYPKVPKTDSPQPRTDTTPEYRQIRIENLEVSAPESAGLIIGLPELPVTGVTLSHVHITARTGLLLRNVDDVELRDVRVDVENGEPLILENARVHKS